MEVQAFQRLNRPIFGDGLCDTLDQLVSVGLRLVCLSLNLLGFISAPDGTKPKEVPIFGEPTRLRAEVETLNELSGHADQQELLSWMKPFAKSLKRIFLVHGEPAQSEGLAKAIQERYGLEPVIPTRGQSFDLT